MSVTRFLASSFPQLPDYTIRGQALAGIQRVFPGRSPQLLTALCLLTSVLCSCTHIPSNDMNNTIESKASRQYHPHINMAGRLSAQYQHNNQVEAVHVGFYWAQTPEQTEITFNSPTGQTLATLVVTALGARLIEANKPERYASDANQLMVDILGWPLPVAGLRNWMQGFMDDAHHVAIAPSQTPDTYFVVDNWNIHYVAWTKVNAESNVERPKRIDLFSQTEEVGLVSLRIVIDQWKTP